jgi:hypothetical protein
MNGSKELTITFEVTKKAGINISDSKLGVVLLAEGHSMKLTNRHYQFGAVPFT